MLPGTHPAEIEPYALFMFCGILPWTWFSSSLSESANVLIGHGNLIKKVLFPAEILPIVTVLANMVHFFLGLPILIGFLIYYWRPITLGEIAWFPVVVLIQALFTTGMALILSALTVHFRDIKDLLSNLLTFWFFATPIIYPMTQAVNQATGLRQERAEPEPLHAPGDFLPGDPVLPGPVRPLAVAAGARRGVGRAVPDRLLPLRSPARFLRGGGVAMANAIEVRDVSKVYRRYGHRRQFATLKSAILSGSFVSDLKADETFEALKGVSFDVAKGRTYGIIGRNGSGKSTMLKCVAGITRPTRGTVKVDGRISALIELGAGFHPEISGRENVFINGIMLGLSKKEIAKRFDEIVRFAELEDFIDAPVKTYSSGMYMRLGFAVAIHVDPDVLLVDEVLAVGDEGFTHKCLDKFSDFRRRGKTILLVTHSLGLVERFCDEALWLEGGTRPRHRRSAARGRRLRDRGRGRRRSAARPRGRPRPRGRRRRTPPPAGRRGDAATIRSRSAPRAPAAEPTPTDMFLASAGRWGSREVEIAGVTLIGDEGPGHVFHANEKLIVRLAVTAASPVTDFVFGFGLFNADGVCVYGTNTDLEDLDPAEINGSGQVDFVIDPLGLIEGTYKIDVAVHRRDGYPYDYHRLLYTFRVKSRTKDVGIYRPPHRWVFSDGVKLTTRI